MDKQTSDTMARQPVVGFLSLAPSISDSYPRTQKVRPAADAATAITTTTNKSSAALASKSRRASSLSSTVSDASNASPKNPSVMRFLKLGPVHWGEHLDGHDGDWHDVVVE